MWMAVCGHVINDRKTNNLSLIHLIEQFRVPPDAFVAPGADPVIRPLTQPAYLVATVSWAWPTDTTSDSASVMVQTKTAGGKTVKSQDEPVMIHREGFKRTRLAMDFAGIPLDVPGTYELQLLIDEKHVGTYPLDFEVAAPIDVEAATAPSMRPSAQRPSPRPKPKGLDVAKRKTKRAGS